MQEIKLNGSGLFALSEDLLPVSMADGSPLGANETKKLAERQNLIDQIITECKKGDVWIKLQRGIYKGSIIRANANPKGAIWGNSIWTISVEETPTETKYGISKWEVDRKSAKYKYGHSKSYLRFSSRAGDKAIQANSLTLYADFLSSEEWQNIAILIGYEGPEVICIDEDIRPSTFTDRLDQDVGVGDLVVVGNGYEGLDVCIVKGYGDACRVVLESCETAEQFRVNLAEDNSTNRIMKMQMSLKDTALMMKLSRD